MAEYWIINTTRENNKIKNVRAFVNTIEGLINPIRYTREEIITSIEKAGNHWYTAVLKEKRGNQNIWEQGSEIHVINIEDEKFIRTDRDNTKNDHFDYPSAI
ncbi:MAG: hypothetical protein BV458_05775 [Thermoplasmata archaeon M9B2D]|nr:MAG: hypothetical protein BV458_05775 [Thermoplasmata archaeon M9B2D]